MTLREFKDHIEKFESGTVFFFGISEPFSWRGIYAEVAFEIVREKTTREDILSKIQLAYTNEFTGYKGGEYRYHDGTEIHFEESQRSYSDGEYVANLIAEIEGKEVYKTQEERLVKLAFC